MLANDIPIFKSNFPILHYFTNPSILWENSESLPLLGKFEKLNPVSSFKKEWGGVGGVGPGDPTMRYALIFWLKLSWFGYS